MLILQQIIRSVVTIRSLVTSVTLPSLSVTMMFYTKTTYIPDNQYDHDISSEDEKDPDRHKRMTSSNNSKWILPGSPVSKKMSEITASAGNLFVTSGLGEDVIDRESTKVK